MLIYPMLAMVLLTGFVLVKLFRRRVRAVKEGQVSGKYFKTYRGEVEPDSTVVPARHLVNLFEAPTLFYVACLAAMVTGLESVAIQALAWAYVGVRVVHTRIHLGANRLRPRIRAYAVSWLVLIAMWLYVALHVAMRA